MAKKTGGKGKKAAPSTASSKPGASKPRKPAAEKPSAPAKKPTPTKSQGAKAPKATTPVTTKTKGKEAKPRPAAAAPKPAKAPAPDAKSKGAKKPAKPEPAPEVKKDKKGAAPAAKVVESKPAKSAKAPPPSAKTKPAPAPKAAKPEKPAKGAAKADDKSSKKPSKTEVKAPATALERYSIQSKESMDASRAAAARFAKAAGLQPVQSSMNGDLDETPVTRLTKSPLSKKQLAHFREVLLLKRRQLVGDVTSMESEALTGGSGSLSHLPQHMADQGSDTYDQTLALDLAASQRGMLKEIDDALARIDAGTYGICDMLGVAINPERLEEAPWARYSIDAARRIERGAYAR